ncbi:MAG: carboxypeptidase-like regulatory domain-containing protein [Bacteroidales bacterium]|nr:carboxypeptidase-like regulatory domain-containing protein [Bacteroidales bacterium]
MKHLIAFLSFVLLAGQLSEAQTLQGRVMLNDSTPCAFATVYLPSINRGIAANEFGEYTLDELPAGKLQVEYSCMGQQSVKRELTLSKGETLINNETLSEKLILLPPSIVTVDGENPAHYVLRHVWDQADINRKRIDTWQAEVKYEFGLNDIEVVIKAIPKKYMFVIKTMAGLAGYRKIITLVFDHPSLKAKVSLLRTYLNGKVKDTEQKVYYSNESLTSSEQKTLYENKLLIEPNLFDEIYNENAPWGRKGSSRDKFELVGSYELDGRTIDVLEYSRTSTSEKEKVNEVGDTIKIKTTYTTVTTLHVVEDLWGILKVEKRGEDNHSLNECRDLGGGIYMPISSCKHISFPIYSKEELPKEIERLEKEDRSGWNKAQKQATDAYIEQLKKHQDRDVCFELNFAYDIKYRYFKVK